MKRVGLDMRGHSSVAVGALIAALVAMQCVVHGFTDTSSLNRNDYDVTQLDAAYVGESAGELNHTDFTAPGFPVKDGTRPGAENSLKLPSGYWAGKSKDVSYAEYEAAYDKFAKARADHKDAFLKRKKVEAAQAVAQSPSPRETEEFLNQTKMHTEKPDTTRPLLNPGDVKSEKEVEASANAEEAVRLQNTEKDTTDDKNLLDMSSDLNLGEFGLGELMLEGI